MAKQALENEKAILDSIKDLERLFDDRIVDLANVKGAMHYRHNFVHYRSFLWRANAAVKKSDVKEATDEIVELGTYLNEREQDLKGEKLQTQPMHVYQYYGMMVDKIYNELHK